MDEMIRVYRRVTCHAVFHIPFLSLPCGQVYPNFVCKTEETAKRLSRTYNQVEIKEFPAFFIVPDDSGYGVWYAPAFIIPPDESDKIKIKLNNESNMAIKKAKSLGLTDEEIEMIRGGGR